MATMRSIGANRAMETTETTGTGAYALEGPVAGYTDFRSTIATGQKVAYCVQQASYDGNGDLIGMDFEIGIGTLTHGSPDTLARTLVLQSTNGDAAVNWGPGAKTIFATLPAELVPMMAGALTSGQAGKALVVDATSRYFELGGPYLPLTGGALTGPLSIHHGGDNAVLLRDTRNTDDLVSPLVRLEAGSGSGDDIVIRGLMDGADGYKAVQISIGGADPLELLQGGQLVVPAEASASTHAVRKGQMEAAVNAGPHVAAGYSNLRVSRTGNASIDIDASHITVFDSSGNGRGLRNVDLSVAITTGGVNGLDTGSEASNTWYYGYVIYNPTTNTVAGLLSASPTAPTLPSGYTFARLVTAVRNNASSNFVDYIQRNERVQYRGGTPPEISSGAIGTIGSSWGAAISIASMVPTAVAGEIDVQAWATSSNSRIVMAPNNSYDADPVGANAPPIGGGGTSGAANFTGNIACGTLLLESDNVYVASNANTKSACRGFKISL